jgi:hypothetical protein
VLVEVKNECASREAIGQVLDYAGRLEGATLENLADRFGLDAADLRKRFADRFGHELVVTKERHVVLVAPQCGDACTRPCRS